MLLDSYENCFDIILTKSIIRFNRNTVDLLDTVNKLRLLGIKMIFQQENLSNKDIDSDLFMAILASLAQAESETLNGAIKWGLKCGFESGESKLYARKCYGYNNSETGELVINEEQSIVVRRIYDLYLSRYNVDMIMKKLSADGIKTPTVKDRWSKCTIKKILTNEKYIGNVMLGKTYTGTYVNNQQKVNRGEHDQFIMKGAHEPIISIEIFEQA